MVLKQHTIGSINYLSPRRNVAHFVVYHQGLFKEHSKLFLADNKLPVPIIIFFTHFDVSNSERNSTHEKWMITTVALALTYLSFLVVAVLRQ